MQMALSSIDGIKILNNPGLQEDKTRAVWFIGLGTGCPAVTVGSMLLLYEVAMALFIGFVSLFIANGVHVLQQRGQFVMDVPVALVSLARGNALEQCKAANGAERSVICSVCSEYEFKSLP